MSVTTKTTTQVRIESSGSGKAERAKYQMDGKSRNLTLDGKVDAPIADKCEFIGEPVDPVFKDWKQLAPYLQTGGAMDKVGREVLASGEASIVRVDGCEDPWHVSCEDGAVKFYPEDSGGPQDDADMSPVVQELEVYHWSGSEREIKLTTHGVAGAWDGQDIVKHEIEGRFNADTCEFNLAAETVSVLSRKSSG